MNLYLVTVKCGHVGRDHYMPITFPIKAESGRDAARIARMLPRVKHHHKDAVLDCKEATLDEYCIQILINENDPYLKVKNKQEQKELIKDLAERIKEDHHQEELMKKYRKSSRPNLLFQKRKYMTDCID